MEKIDQYKKNFTENGFIKIENIFLKKEIKEIILEIEKIKKSFTKNIKNPNLHLTKDKKTELKIILIASIIGFLFDGFLLKNEMVLYANHGWSYSITPLWIIVLWMGFAITLNSSLSWLKKKIKLSALFGAIGGPLAYLAGEKLNAVTILSPNAIIVIAIGWSIITPLLIIITNKLPKND